MEIQSQSIDIPDGFILATENTTSILVPQASTSAGGSTSKNAAFLNPIQEFNRDLSVCAIRAWCDIADEEQICKLSSSKKRKRELSPVADANSAKTISMESGEVELQAGLKGERQAKTSEVPRDLHAYSLLEALSATGLRAIRYAKEIPRLHHIVANDLSPAAVEAIRRNVALNQLGPTEEDPRGKVRVTEGDACSLMYSHRTTAAKSEAHSGKFHIIDLDPYGTATPFIDSAIQALLSGGLLCVTCTDLAVLAGSNYPEKCFSNYSGIPLKGDYTHESALRLVLGQLATEAGKYGKIIQPLLSLSIDFYVRVFVRLKESPVETKKLMSQIGPVYACHHCANFVVQPMGRVTEHVTAKGNVNFKYRTAQCVALSDKCTECGQNYHMGGPMWLDPIHDPAFCDRIVKHVASNTNAYGTSARINGMVSTARDEISAPFYFNLGKLAGLFHSSTPSIIQVGSALLNGGFEISRSHAMAGSIKTNAPRSVIFDIYRALAVIKPPNMAKVAEGSPARTLLSKIPKFFPDFTQHASALKMVDKTTKIMRYLEPPPFWGPLSRASGSAHKKEKNSEHQITDMQ